jgi:hypothetical protein
MPPVFDHVPILFCGLGKPPRRCASARRCSREEDQQNEDEGDDFHRCVLVDLVLGVQFIAAKGKAA